MTAHDALTARLLGLALANTPTSMLDPPLDKRNRQQGKPVKNLYYISIHEMALGKGSKNQNGNLRWHLP